MTSELTNAELTNALQVIVISIMVLLRLLQTRLSPECAKEVMNG